jgi:PAS domain S-box-containing protein
VVAFLVILGAQFWLSLEALDGLASLSGYRRGLEDWSRARASAVGRLEEYGERGDPAEWDGFLSRLDALKGFETTRRALSVPEPDEGRLRQALARQGASEEDVRQVVRASEQLRNLPRWSPLLSLWTDAARRVEELGVVASAIHAQVLSGTLDSREAASSRRRLGELDRELERIERSFSTALQESREVLERRFRTQQVTAVGLLVVLVLGLGLWTSIRLDREMGNRLEAEQALRESQLRLRDILEHSTNLFYSRQPDHRLTYVSHHSREFLGCEPEKALRRWTQFVTDHPDNRKGLDLAERAIRTGERQPPYELELRRADGGLLWVQVDETPLVRDGRTAAVVGSLTDITERRRAEEERRRLEERLGQVERLEAVGRLAGGVAHDFNNLLTAILGHCDLAMAAIHPEHPARTRLLEVKRAGRRAARLTRQLLAFSRREAIEPRILDLNRAASEATSMLRRLIGEDVRLELHLRAAPATVLLDPSQVDQLLVNLAVNARDAIQGEGRIVIETDLEHRDAVGPDDPVDLPAGDYVILTVSDTGQGMDRITQQHAFEPFFTTKERGSGTGLGLATVYGIVKQNGGFITLDSEPGAGATFRMFFPKAQGRVEEGQPEASPTRPGRGSGRVLLVEDEPAVREFIRRVLVERGYSVLEAAEGTAALALLGEPGGEIDLLISDLGLPGMSGEALAGRISQLRPDLAMLFISGFSDTVLGERGVVREGVELLKKPFEAPELLARVEELIGASRGHVSV